MIPFSYKGNPCVVLYRCPPQGGNISISGLWRFKGLMDVNLSHRCSVSTNAGVTVRKFKLLEC